MEKQERELKDDILRVLPGHGGASIGLTFESICEKLPRVGWCWRMRTDVATILSHLQHYEKRVVKVDLGHEYRYSKRSYNRKWGPKR